MNHHTDFTDQVVGVDHGVGSRAVIRIAATILVTVAVAVFGIGALAQAHTGYPPGPTTTIPSPTVPPTTSVPDEPDFPPGPLTIEIERIEFPLGDPVEFAVVNCQRGETATATFDGQTKTSECDDAFRTGFSAFRTGFSFPGPAACGPYPITVSAADQTASVEITVVDNLAAGRPCSPVPPTTTVPGDGDLPGTGTSNTISMIQIGIGLLVTGAVLVGVVMVRRSRLRTA